MHCVLSEIKWDHKAIKAHNNVDKYKSAFLIVTSDLSERARVHLYGIW